MKVVLRRMRTATAVLVTTILLCGQGAGAQTTTDEAEFQQLFDQIQLAKQAGLEIPAGLYDRYFDLDARLNPPAGGRHGGGNPLDQGVDGWPGLLITQPPAGPFFFTDAGQTYNSNNDCPLPRCRNGRDLIYALDLVRPTWLQISTCGSNFDTYLCVFPDSCCPSAGVPLFYNDDNPQLCGARSLKAAISACFVQPGRYYIVLDGYNSTATGHYVFTIQDVPDSSCGSTPAIECPANFTRHTETLDEAPCEFGVPITCGAGYCGDVDMLGDLDVFTFSLTECQQIELSVYADATPGRSGFGGGLDPTLRLLGSPGCDHAIATNNDFGGAAPDPVGQDSRIVTACLRRGTYWLEVSGNGAIGPYELIMNCTPCPSPPPVGGIVVDHPRPGRNCLAWPVQPGNPTYYVWRQLPGQEWRLAGSTYRALFCENLADGETAAYQVFADPCGHP